MNQHTHETPFINGRREKRWNKSRHSGVGWEVGGGGEEEFQAMESEPTPPSGTEGGPGLVGGQ